MGGGKFEMRREMERELSESSIYELRIIVFIQGE